MGDSYVIAETFKYLYLLFAEESDLLFDIDDFIFTTEGHLLPLSLSIFENENFTTTKIKTMNVENFEENNVNDRSCPNNHLEFPDGMSFAYNVRKPLENLVKTSCPKKSEAKKGPRFTAAEFTAGNTEHHAKLQKMGIRILTMSDGRIQLIHSANQAESTEYAENGALFMQEMIDFSKNQNSEVVQDPRIVQIISDPYYGDITLNAGPAQFGEKFKDKPGIEGRLVIAEPYKACQPIKNFEQVEGNIALIERGDCMFIEKARNLMKAKALGGIVIDHNEGTSSKESPVFSMSGDGKDD